MFQQQTTTSQTPISNEAESTKKRRCRLSKIMGNVYEGIERNTWRIRIERKKIMLCIKGEEQKK